MGKIFIAFMGLLIMAAPARGADLDYGEYLAGECSSCHSIQGASAGIPPLNGLPEDYFIDALDEYVNGPRDNEAMKSVVLSLDDEQKRALAAWFAQLDPY